MKRGAIILALGAVLAWSGSATSASAARVYYPGGGNPPATQITRDFSLKDAAQRGLVSLRAKGNGFQGDQVEISLINKKVRGPITVTVHAEFSTKPGFPQDGQDNLRDGLPEYERRTEAVLNQGNYKTSKGDPIRFDVEYRFRNPADPETAGYHQILVIDPTRDLDQPDPNYRARTKGLGVPNALGAEKSGTFSSLTFTKPKTLAHETLHLAGLDDRYGDFYKVGGKKYPLPAKGMSQSQLAEFARKHRPRLPPPPAGEIVSDNVPGTGPCDIMADSAKDCSRISKRDLKFFEDQAGIEVDAEPGDLILNKDASDQNFGVGVPTRVFASPGQATVAEGLSVYCIDANLGGPQEKETFDVIGPASQVPGLEPAARLFALSGQLQTSVDPVPGMQTAIWNVTNGEDIDQSLAFDPEAARAILSQAGIAEDSYPQGLPYLPDPNAGSAGTAAVTQGGVIKTLRSKRTKRRSTARIQFAQLYPSHLHAGGLVRADLFFSLVGSADRMGIKLQQRSGGHWRKVRKLGARKVKLGTSVLALKLGRIGAGSYRLQLAATKHHRVQSTRRVPFRVGS